MLSSFFTSLWLGVNIKSWIWPPDRFLYSNHPWVFDDHLAVKKFAADKIVTVKTFIRTRIPVYGNKAERPILHLILRLQREALHTGKRPKTSPKRNDSPWKGVDRQGRGDDLGKCSSGGGSRWVRWSNWSDTSTGSTCRRRLALGSGPPTPRLYGNEQPNKIIADKGISDGAWNFVLTASHDGSPKAQHTYTRGINWRALSGIPCGSAPWMRIRFQPRPFFSPSLGLVS